MCLLECLSPAVAGVSGCAGPLLGSSSRPFSDFHVVHSLLFDHPLFSFAFVNASVVQLTLRDINDPFVLDFGK